ncbi:MAG: hypothetical protein AAF230_01330 [Pseudomonadota bacterium]
MGRYGKACFAGLAVFFLFYVIAFIVAVIGTRGLFGVEQNTMSIIFLILLGMPWSMTLAGLPADGLEIVGRLVVALAPILNLWLLSRACRRRRRRQRRR